MEAEDLLAGNPNLNYLFAYDLFLNKPNIQVTEQEKFEAAGLLKDDVGDSREERCIFLLYYQPYLTKY